MPTLTVNYEIKTRFSEITSLKIGNIVKGHSELKKDPGNPSVYKGIFKDAYTAKEKEVYVRVRGNGTPGFKTELTLKVKGKSLTDKSIELIPNKNNREMYYSGYLKWR